MIRHRACHYFDGVSTINGPTMTARTLRHDQPNSGRFSIQLLSGLFAFGTTVAIAHCVSSLEIVSAGVQVSTRTFAITSWRIQWQHKTKRHARIQTARVKFLGKSNIAAHSAQRWRTYPTSTAVVRILAARARPTRPIFGSMRQQCFKTKEEV
jgi:hypothetical protein